MMRTTEARVLFEPLNESDRYLPEGPREMTVDGDPVVTWINIRSSPDSPRGSILGYRRNQVENRFSFLAPGKPGFALPATGGRMLVGTTKEIRTFRLADGEWQEPLVAIPDANPRTIINDAEIVPGGKAIVFGTKDIQFREPIANLYLFTVDDNRLSLLLTGQTCSNGKVFAADSQGLILYDIDTPTRRIARYLLDIDRRTATPDGIALDLSDWTGFPDGMCDCGDGTVIIAFYNPDFDDAGRAIRFDLGTGQALEEWTTPLSPRVTCPLLVKKADGVKLILTTATEGMPFEMRERCHNAGCLFIADTQFANYPEPEVVRLP